MNYFLADTGPCFSHVDLLTLLHVLNIKRIGIGAYHPESNGKAESYIKKLKYVLKKSLAVVFPIYSLLDILPIVTKQMNETPDALSHLTPLQLLHGQTSKNAEISYLQTSLPKLYPPLYNHANNVARKQKETEEILTFLREELKLEKMEKNVKLNKNRFLAKLEPGDYCFAKDRAILLGSTRPLKTVFSNDP